MGHVLPMKRGSQFTTSRDGKKTNQVRVPIRGEKKLKTKSVFKMMFWSISILLKRTICPPLMEFPIKFLFYLTLQNIFLALCYTGWSTYCFFVPYSSQVKGSIRFYSKAKDCIFLFSSIFQGHQSVYATHCFIELLGLSLLKTVPMRQQLF